MPEYVYKNDFSGKICENKRFAKTINKDFISNKILCVKLYY